MERRRWLRLRSIHWRGRQLWIAAELDGHRFSTSVWYGDVDLEQLAAALGRAWFERIAFHVAAFEINKLCSLTPTHVSFGPFARFVTAPFVALWSQVLRGVWAQWRYEHDWPDWRGPEIVDPIVAEPEHSGESAAPKEPGAEGLLLFGGGKDSLVAAELLQHARVPYATLTYAHSAYGAPGPQHRLVDTLLDRLAPVRRHKQWIADDAFAAPLPELVDGSASRALLAGETPSSIFAALPVVLARGYPWMALAHEFSANFGNLVWSRTGEVVNHQWGKSWEAESALAAYIAAELVPGFHWFSILQPLSDVLIFELLRGASAAAPFTHSCNLRKPWCHRCAKCAYVALGYAAHLPDGVYERVFEEDVLDLPETQPFFRQMIGLGEHTPFECIGEIDEARLALALVAARGRRCRAVELFRREGGRVDLPAVLDRYASVHTAAPHGIPAPLARELFPIFRAAERSARARISAVLGG